MSKNCQPAFKQAPDWQYGRKAISQDLAEVILQFLPELVEINKQKVIEYAEKGNWRDDGS